jgi:uncharacterized protein (DUF1800 family)
VLVDCLVLLAACGADQPWTAREAEHLLNRAAFGASAVEVRAAVERGRAATIELLFAPPPAEDPPWFERVVLPDRKQLRELSDEEFQALDRAARETDRRQLVELWNWWLQRMASGVDPLRERMVLFWHGHFTTSTDKVVRSWPVVQQHRLLREHALGSYAQLLRGMVSDAAMLAYLDNTSNRRGRPNENLARELMELFSLGQGNYTEADIKEAARALTGRTTRNNEYHFDAGAHDAGEKTVLGASGRIDGEQLVDILLAQDACPRWIAGRLLSWLEGAPPSVERVERYARILEDSDWRVEPVLRALFVDPEFYRDEIVGARVASPVDYLVGGARRLRLDVPSFVLNGGAILLGQKLGAPPTVKGWDEGEAWITTSTLMQRGNLAGLMLGTVTLDQVVSQADLVAGNMARLDAGAPPPSDDAMGAAGDDAMSDLAMGASSMSDEPVSAERLKGLKPGKANGAAIALLRRLDSTGYLPRANFTSRVRAAGAASDAEVADALLDDLLAIPVPEDTRERLRLFLARERADRDLREGAWLQDEQTSERILRRVAHLILSLPEAQLH